MTTLGVIAFSIFIVFIGIYFIKATSSVENNPNY